MKKLFRTLLTISIFLSFSPAVFSQPRAGNEKYSEFKVVLNDVNFTVDPRIELYQTMEVVSGMPLVKQPVTTIQCSANP